MPPSLASARPRREPTTGSWDHLRALKTARKTAINSRRVALQMIQALMISAHEELRDQLRNMTRMPLIRTLAGWRPTSGYRDPVTDRSPQPRSRRSRWLHAIWS